MRTTMTHLGTMVAAAAALALTLGAATRCLHSNTMPEQDPAAPDGTTFARALDREGVVAGMPLAASGGARWRPLEAGLELRPGDWVEAGTRGANAALLELSSGVRLTLGPGALAELAGPESVTLHRGELACLVPDGARLVVSAPGTARSTATGVEVRGRAVLRATDAGVELS